MICQHYTPDRADTAEKACCRRGGRQQSIPIYFWLPLLLWTLLAAPHLIDPEPHRFTALTITFTILFHPASFRLLRNGQIARRISLGLIAVAMALLLTNPSILTLRNYRFSDDVPIGDDLQAAEVDHPIFGEEPFLGKFLQTSDGALYYSASHHRLRREGPLIRETAFNCAVRNHSLGLIRRLADHGANPNMSTRGEESGSRSPNAMFLALHRRMDLRDRLTLLMILKGLGVDLTARDEDGATPRDLVTRERARLKRHVNPTAQVEQRIADLDRIIPRL